MRTTIPPRGCPLFTIVYTDRYISLVWTQGAAKKTILDVSLRLFVERGYEAVGVQEIVEKSGVTKPTLYHHFGSKRGLLDALCNRLSGVLDPVLAAAEGDGVLSVTLTSLIRALFAVAVTHPREFRLLLLIYHSPAGSPVREAGAGLQSQFRDGLEALFTRAVEHHGNMEGRARAYTVSLIGTLFAYGLLLVDGEIEMNDELPYRVMHQFSHGVYS